jgi:hypothetical protein
VPVIEIHALPKHNEVRIPEVLRNTTHAVAEAAGIDKKQVWATWIPIPAGAYAEGDDIPVVQPGNSHPPIVHLYAFEGRTKEQREAMLNAAAESVTTHMQLEPGNAFVVYHEIGAGYVYDNGQVVQGK